jgi:hypothetical protein
MALYSNFGLEEITEDSLVVATQGTVMVKRENGEREKLPLNTKTQVRKGDTLYWGPGCAWNFSEQ